MVTIACISENQVLQSQTEQFLDYYLDTQDADGWLGPEIITGRPRRLSGRRAYYSKSFLLMLAHTAGTLGFRFSWGRCVSPMRSPPEPIE